MFSYNFDSSLLAPPSSPFRNSLPLSSSCLSPDEDGLSLHNLLDRLGSGVLLCRLADIVSKKAQEARQLGLSQLVGSAPSLKIITILYIILLPISCGCYMHLPISCGCYTHLPISCGCYTHLPISCGCYTHLPISNGCYMHLPISCGCYTHLPISYGCYMHLPISCGCCTHLPISCGSLPCLKVCSPLHQEDFFRSSIIMR